MTIIYFRNNKIEIAAVALDAKNEMKLNRYFFTQKLNAIVKKFLW